MDKAASAGLGRPDPRARSRPTSSRTRCSTAISTTTTRTPPTNDAGDVDQGQGRDEAVQVRHQQDGICDAPECSGVLLDQPQHASVDGHGAGHRGRPAPRSASSSNTRELEDRVHDHPDRGKNGPDLGRPRLGQGLRGRLDVHGRCSTAGRSSPQGNMNYSLVGHDRRPGEGVRVDAGNRRRGIPSVDADIDKCNADARTTSGRTCWEDLDKKLMEKVVPWVPYLVRQRRSRHRPGRDEVRVRPVLRHTGLLADRRRHSRKQQ